MGLGGRPQRRGATVVTSHLITVSGCRWQCLVAEEVFFGFFTVTFPLTVADIAPPPHPALCGSVTNTNKIPDLQKIPGLSDTDIKWEVSRFLQRKSLSFNSPSRLVTLAVMPVGSEILYETPTLIFKYFQRFQKISCYIVEVNLNLPQETLHYDFSCPNLWRRVWQFGVHTQCQMMAGNILTPLNMKRFWIKI